jgi:hypothetical protein
MAKAKAKKPNAYATWQQYPKPAASRGGCKVSWNYYRTREEAETCSKAAQHNADIAWREGYDFGYCSPGSIREMPAGSKIGEAYFRDKIEDVSGMFEVCLP